RRRRRRRFPDLQPMKPAPVPAPEKVERSRRFRAAMLFLTIACCLLSGWPVSAQRPVAPPKKPKKEEITQTLQLPKELPSAVIGETRRLTFHVTPLSGRGLLSAQIRDALKALTRETGNNPVLKIRAFVAGSGDLRRVRDRS